MGREKKGGVTKNTRRLTACAMLCALNVIFLYAGTVVEVLDLSMSFVASLTEVFAVLELGFPAAWWVFGATGVLSVLLIPLPKTSALIFVLFTGYYPILKAYLERLPNLLCWLSKCGVFNAALTILVYGTAVVFTGGARAGWVTVAIYVAGNVTFVLYDFALTRLVTVYLRVWRGRFHIGNRFR